MFCLVYGSRDLYLMQIRFMLCRTYPRHAFVTIKDLRCHHLQSKKQHNWCGFVLFVIWMLSHNFRIILRMFWIHKIRIWCRGPLLLTRFKFNPNKEREIIFVIVLQTMWGYIKTTIPWYNWGSMYMIAMHTFANTIELLFQETHFPLSTL